MAQEAEMTMLQQNATYEATPDGNLIYPPTRSAWGEAAVICAVVTFLSTIMVVPHGTCPWTIAAGALLAVCTIGFRFNQAIHLSLFCLLWVVLPQIFSVSRPWPFSLIVPLIFYGILVAVFPPLHRSVGWLRRGRLGSDVLMLVLATMFVSSVALIIWYTTTKPDHSQILRYMPQMPLWMFPLAGVGFAMCNAALEEAIFRGIIMEALDSAFGPGSISVSLQAVPFALLHKHGFPGGGWGMALVLVYGLMLGAIRRRSQGMLAPWLAHVGADVCIFAILAWVALG